MSTNLGDLLKARGFAASEPAEEASTTEAVAPGEPTWGPKVVVRATRKGRGGKTVTEVQGVLTERDHVAKMLKKQLGTGARTEGELVVVQGDQVERVVSWLTQRGVAKVVRG